MYAKVKEEVRSYCPSIYILAVGPLILDPSITNTSFVICWLITLCPSKNLYFILVKPFEINENIFFKFCGLLTILKVVQLFFLVKKCLLIRLKEVFIVKFRSSKGHTVGSCMYSELEKGKRNLTKSSH